jgi:hypothetical protein
MFHNRKTVNRVRVGVLTAVVMKSSIFWDIMPRSLFCFNAIYTCCQSYFTNGGLPPISSVQPASLYRLGTDPIRNAVYCVCILKIPPLSSAYSLHRERIYRAVA